MVQTYINQISPYQRRSKERNQYCRTDNMIADMLTKGLYAERVAKLREMTGLKEPKQQYDPK